MKSGPRKKIPALIEKYELDNVDKKMVAKWTHPDRDRRWTLKRIRSWFNQSILRAAMIQSGMNPVPGEVEYGYEYLRNDLENDELNESDRQDFIDRLESNGVDTDEIMDDFISSNTTFLNYLSDSKGALHPSKSDDENQDDKGFSREAMITRFQRMKARYEQVSDDAVNTLIKNNEFDDVEFETSVDFIVDLPETGESFYLEQILSNQVETNYERSNSSRKTS